ncbi:MAG: hypothetical protein GY820_21060, partial [Gammaproteobacteria bacterium]|nr:hypothetical protein [Gammaproteobacteria bacterium]
ASAVTGSIAVNVGMTFIMMATPVGWVGLLVGGLAVAGVAAGASLGMNYAVKENSGVWYDQVMKWLGDP